MLCLAKNKQHIMRAASLLLLTATYAQQQRIAIYVLSTGKSKRLNGTHTEPLHWLTQRALPALDTWAKGFDRVVFVVEKGFESSAAGRGCRPARDGTLVCPRLADAHLLAADCTDEYRGAGPCCKCDAAFAHAAGAARPWDWVGFADDDVFFDPVGTCVEINQCVGCTVRNRHRHAIEQASPPWRGGRRTLRKILISTQVGTRHALYSAGDVDAPVAVVPQGSRRRPPFHAPARCRTAMRASYWAQPALLSRGALARAAAAFRAGGTQSECRLFDVSHEGGLGVLLWSLGVESLGLPEPDAYLRDSRYLRGLPGAREFRRMRLQRPKHKPVAVHRVARGNDYPTAHAVRAALASPEYTRIPATATVLRGAIPPRDVSPGAPFAPFRPEDCAPPSPLS